MINKNLQNFHSLPHSSVVAEVSLGFQGGGTALTCSGNRLSVIVVGHVACGEQSGSLR